MRKFGAIALGWRKPLTVPRVFFPRTRDTDNILRIDYAKSKGELMIIDIYAKSVQLLERVANSVHEREPKSPNLLCFSTNEVQVVEEWLKELIEDLEK